MLHKIDLTTATSAELSPDQVLINLRLKALSTKEVYVVLSLGLLTVEIEPAHFLLFYVDLDRVECDIILVIMTSRKLV